MVGALKLMKILHCRSNAKRIRDNSGRITSRKDKYTTDFQVDIKVEPLAYNTNTCRVCLQEGNIDIFGENNSEDLCDSIHTIAGINVTYIDPYPKCLCQPCHALLQGAILFRKTALKSQRIMEKSAPDRALNPVKEETLEACDGDSNDADNGYANSIVEYDRSISGEEQITKEKRKLDRQDHADHAQFSENKDETSKKTNSHEQYKSHKIHAKVPSKYMCDICGKFSSEYHFMRHRLTHFYDLPVKCTLCPYRGRFQESLKMHMRSHTGERPYQCEQCSARFMSKSNLNKHTLTHKAHNFRCEACCKGYYTQRELDLHIKIDHTGVKAHECRYCDKSFGYRKQVMKHELKVHKREKMKSGRLIYVKLESMKQQNEALNGIMETMT